MIKTCSIRVSALTRKYYIGFGAARSTSEYKTFAGALRAATNKGYVVDSTVDPMIEFAKNDKRTKIVENLMSGRLVRIPVNTPECSDPSTETYWSS